MKSKAIAFTAPGVAEYVDREFNLPDHENYIVVHKYVSTVSCGTERANLMGHPNVAGGNKVDMATYYPRFLGYSSSGVVEKVGKNITDIKVGDRVAVSWGIHTEYEVCERHNVAKLPDNVSFEDAALCHITTFPLAGVRKTNLEIGESAMTVGLGLLGQMSIMFQKLAGAYPVIAADPNPERRKLALKNGADYAFDPTKDDFVENVRRVTDGRMVNACVEVTGNGPALDRALDVMAEFGRVSLLGCTRDSDFSIDYYKKIHAPGITMVGAHTNARPVYESHEGWWTEKHDREAVLRLISAGRLDFSDFVCETHSPKEAGEVYARLANDKNFPVCVQFDWRK